MVDFLEQAEQQNPSHVGVFNCYHLLPYVYVYPTGTAIKQQVEDETIFQSHYAWGLKRTGTIEFTRHMPQKSRKDRDDHYHPQQSPL